MAKRAKSPRGRESAKGTRGRPRKYEAGKSVRTGCQLPTDVVAGLDAWAAERGLNRNDAIVTACERLIQARR